MVGYYSLGKYSLLHLSKYILRCYVFDYSSMVWAWEKVSFLVFPYNTCTYVNRHVCVTSILVFQKLRCCFPQYPYLLILVGKDANFFTTLSPCVIFYCGARNITQSFIHFRQKFLPFPYWNPHFGICNIHLRENDCKDLLLNMAPWFSISTYPTMK